jgi:hypothetical protein
MKHSTIVLRYQIATPDARIDANANVHDVFRAPDYRCEDDGVWMHITHVASGACRRVPVCSVKCADPVQVEQAPVPAQAKGKR